MKKGIDYNMTSDSKKRKKEKVLWHEEGQMLPADIYLFLRTPDAMLCLKAPVT